MAQDASSKQVLEEVRVTAQRAEVEHDAERTVYDLRNSLQAKMGSVSDVLNTLPSVSVAPNGNVSVGGSAVTVLIDGKPSPLLRGIGMSVADALQTMPANSIASIEVITNPGPEFRMNGATIINLITAKPQEAAWNSNVIISAGPSGRHNGSVSASYRREKWTFSGNGGVREDLRYDILDREIIAKNPDGSAASLEVEHRPTYVPYTSTFGTFLASYAIASHDTVSFGGEGALNHRPRHFVDSRIATDSNGTATSNSVTNDSAKQHFDHFSVTGDYTRKGLFGGDTLMLKLKHEDYDTRRDSTDDESFIAPASAVNVYRQLRVERELIDTFSGDYVLSTAKDRELKVGIEVESDSDESSRIAGTDPFVANEAAQFHLDRTLFVSYAGYRSSHGNWTLNAGLRAEEMSTRFSQDDETSTTLHDLQWSPSLSASRELSSDSELSFNYRRRISRPTANEMNPLRAVVIGITDMGNPYLEPGATQSFNIRYHYATKPVTLSGAVYVRLMSNEVVSYQYAPTPGSTALVSSFENAGSGNAVGVDVSLTRVWAKSRIDLSSDLYHVRQSAPVAGIDITSATFTHLTKLGVTWTPDARNSLQAQGQLRGRALSAEGTRSGYGSLNISYGHSFTPRLKLIVNANDIFNTVSYQELIDTPQYREQSEFTIPGQVFYVGLTYSLGAIAAEK